jgi:hypothetical protein
MSKQVKRRQFIKTSAFGFGGLFVIGKGAKKYVAQVNHLHDDHKPELSPNNWSQILQEGQGARRFSSFRYVPDINRFLLWGFHGFYTSDYGNPENPWSGNKEYDIVAFNPVTGRWENHFPHSKTDEWNKSLPPMHHVNSYQGITPGYYRPQLRERGGILRPDLNIVGDQVTYDSRRHRMVYFTGGRTLAYQVEERRWMSIDGDKAPPPVSFGSLCYDPFGDRIILSGGGHIAENGYDGRIKGFTGTWVYDCEVGNWSPVDISGDPPPRMCTRLVCDTRNKVMVVFGGDGQSHWRADTWLLDLERYTWRKSKAAGVPEARAGHFTVYDPTTGLVITGGGYNYKELTDMWGYNVASDTWLRLHGEVPSGWYVTADIMPEAGIILLTTSTKLKGDTHRCNEIYPVRTTYTYLIKEQGLVDETAVPGQERELLKRPVKNSTEGTEPDTVRHNEQMTRIQKMADNRWVHFADPGRIAPVRTWGSCAFDTDKGRIIYWGGGHCGYGGNDYDFYNVEQNTWVTSPIRAEYPERAWDKGISPGGVTFNGNPWMTHGRKVYAYDPVSRKVINTKIVHLTGGYEPDPLKDIEPKKMRFGKNENFTTSYYVKWVTWVYHEEKQSWEIICSGLPGLDLLVQTPHGVMGVDYNWGAIDSQERPDMTTWKGEPMVDNSVYLLDVAGRNWRKITREGPWPQNLYEMTALVYDSRRDQLILHGGGPDRNELWRFPLNTGQWEKIEPDYASDTGGQPPVCNREAVYLPDDDVLFTAGTPAGEISRAGFWAYRVDENRWYRINIEPSEGRTMNDMLGQNRAWTYDPIHDILFMILGENAGWAMVYGMKFNFGLKRV